MMSRLNRYVSLVLVLLLFVLPARPQEALVRMPKVAPYKLQPSAAALKWANDELKRMSLAEKIGQTIAIGLNATFLNQEAEAYRTLKHYIEDDKAGSLILFRGPVYESVILVNRMQQLAKYP